MSSFESSDLHTHPRLQPLRVALTKQGLFEEAATMAKDLGRRGWRVLSVDESKLSIECERRGGFLRGNARITLQVEGPDGVPSAVLHVRSHTPNALWPRDRANVLEFMVPFHRRVC